MIAALLWLLGKVAPGLATIFGDVFIRAKQTQVEQDKVGATVAQGWLHSVTEANRTRAEVQKEQGTWGPLGLITVGIGSAFVFHVWWVVLDSTPWSVPFLAGAHRVGSWGVATLGKLHDVEIEAIRALFYTAPPAAAAVVVAKAFRK